MTAYWMLLVFLIFCCYAVAFIRKGKIGMAMPERKRLLTVGGAPDDVFHALLHIPAPFGIDDKDPASHQIIIQKPVALFGGWGFFFPVRITANPGGGSSILVGCTSKVFQMGPLVTRAHDRCVEAILTTLAVAPARVVAS